MDIFQGSPAQANCRRNVTEAAFHQNHIRRINGDICTGSDGNSHIGSGKCRCIVDSITHHRNFSFFLQVSDDSFFSVRKYSGNDFVHAGLAADCLCRPFIITSQHDNMDTHVLQLFNCLRTIFFDHICHRNHTQ